MSFFNRLTNILMFLLVVPLLVLFISWQWELSVADAAFENLKAGNYESLDIVNVELLEPMKKYKLFAKDEYFNWGRIYVLRDDAENYMAVNIYPRPFSKTIIELSQ